MLFQEIVARAKQAVGYVRAVLWDIIVELGKSLREEADVMRPEPAYDLKSDLLAKGDFSSLVRLYPCAELVGDYSEYLQGLPADNAQKHDLADPLLALRAMVRAYIEAKGVDKMVVGCQHSLQTIATGKGVGFLTHEREDHRHHEAITVVDLYVNPNFYHMPQCCVF